MHEWWPVTDFSQFSLFYFLFIHSLILTKRKSALNPLFFLGPSLLFFYFIFITTKNLFILIKKSPNLLKKFDVHFWFLPAKLKSEKRISIKKQRQQQILPVRDCSCYIANAKAIKVPLFFFLILFCFLIYLIFYTLFSTFYCSWLTFQIQTQQTLLLSNAFQSINFTP